MSVHKETRKPVLNYCTINFARYEELVNFESEMRKVFADLE